MFIFVARKCPMVIYKIKYERNKTSFQQQESNRKNKFENWATHKQVWPRIIVIIIIIRIVRIILANLVCEMIVCLLFWSGDGVVCGTHIIVECYSGRSACVYCTHIFDWVCFFFTDSRSYSSSFIVQPIFSSVSLFFASPCVVVVVVGVWNRSDGIVLLFSFCKRTP